MTSATDIEGGGARFSQTDAEAGPAALEARTKALGVQQALRWLAWAALVVFCVSLPLFEAPKNISLGVALVSTLGYLAARREAARWDAVCALLLALTLTGALSAALNQTPWPLALKNASDMARILAAYWLVLNLVRSEGEAATVAELLLASAALALLWSLGTVQSLKFMSVASLGWCNNVGMYYSQVAALGFSLSLIGGGPWWRRLWWGAALGIAVAALSLALCRSGIVAFVLFCGVALVGTKAWRQQTWWLMALALAAVAAMVAGEFKTMPEVAHLWLDTNSLAERWRIWQLAAKFFSEHPLLGIGPGNFKAAAEAALGAGVRDYYYLGNAHSLYLNTLAERGIVGMILLAAFIIAAWRGLFAIRPTLTRAPLPAALWWAGLGSLMIVVLIGVIDHPLHHEHALLMAALLALPRALAAGVGSPHGQ